MPVRGKKTEQETESETQTAQQGGKPKRTQSKAPAKKPTGSKTAKKAPAKKAPAKKAPAKKAPAKGKQKGGNTEKGDRYFKLINPKTGKSYGRYTGDTPKQAASKGFTKMLQKLKKEGKTPPKQTVIYLRESTRGSNRKYYGYEASRLKLAEPQELVITNEETGEEKTITYNFRNRIKKVPVPEQIGGAKTKKGANKTAKKPSGSKTAKKAPAKKTPVKKAPAKKTPSKKAPAKKGAKGK